MRIDGFARSVGFAALAGAAWLPFVLLVSPLLGLRAAAALYLGAVATLYVSGLSAGSAAGLLTRAGIPLAVALGSLLMALTSGSLASAAAGLTALLALARSALLAPRAAAPGPFVELALGATSLAMAGFLFGGSIPGLAFAIWGYFLTQSAFFLLSAGARQPRSAAERDPFDRAISEVTTIIGND